MGLMETKRRVFSGIQPSGTPHLGTYLGALKNWVSIQDEYDCHYCVVDMHAITVPQDPKVLRHNVRELAAIFLAVGLDPERAVIFRQSRVSAHAELAWLLNCVAKVGELSRMTQFKDKASKGGAEAASPEKPAITNLLEIYAVMAGKSVPEVEEMYRGKGYGDFKGDLAEVIVEALSPIRDRALELLEGDPRELDGLLEMGAEKARKLASSTLHAAWARMGLD